MLFFHSALQLYLRTRLSDDNGGYNGFDLLFTSGQKATTPASMDVGKEDTVHAENESAKKLKDNQLSPRSINDFTNDEYSRK